MELQQFSTSKKQIPIGMRAISIMCYVVAVLNAVYSFLLYTGYGAIYDSTGLYAFYRLILASVGFNGLISIIDSGTFASGGSTMLVTMFGGIDLTMLGLIGISVLWFCVGKSLAKTKKWARKTAIIGFTIGVVSPIYLLIFSEFFYFLPMFSLPINLIALMYLIFSKSAKSAFSVL